MFNVAFLFTQSVTHPMRMSVLTDPVIGLGFVDHENSIGFC